jgi:hypothetical protein
MAVGRRLHWQSVRSEIKAARKTAWACRPTHVCPYCGGKGESDEYQGAGGKCRACHGHGWVSQVSHDNHPEILKARAEARGKS